MNDAKTAKTAVAVLTDEAYAEQFTPKRLKEKLGPDRLRVVGDELHIKESDHDFRTPTHFCLSIDRENGTFTSFNIYGEKGDVKIGKNFDMVGMTYDLPAEGDKKWKKWGKDGYKPIGEHDSSQFGFSELADVDVFQLRIAEEPVAVAKPVVKPVVKV